MVPRLTAPQPAYPEVFEELEREDVGNCEACRL